MAYYYFPWMIKLRKLFRRIVRYIHYINKTLINLNYKTKYNKMSLETDTNHTSFVFSLNRLLQQLLVAY